MKYNRLGRTGLYVSELCLGTMTLGGMLTRVCGLQSALLIRAMPTI